VEPLTRRPRKRGGRFRIFGRKKYSLAESRGGVKAPDLEVPGDRYLEKPVPQEIRLEKGGNKAQKGDIGPFGGGRRIESEEQEIVTGKEIPCLEHETQKKNRETR